MSAKYINPFTDFGFKKIFGEEANKLLLIDFLNALLPEKNKIANIIFKNTEQRGSIAIERRVSYDIYCENEIGEKFIVEMQKTRQNHFKERTLYYSIFPIKEQAETGDLVFDFKAIYCIGILDFIFHDYSSKKAKNRVFHIVKLKDEDGETFYDKLTYIFIELPKFKKKENQLRTRLDKWFYFIQHLKDFESMPLIFKDEIFEQAFAKAEMANFQPAELRAYEMNLKAYRDVTNSIDYSRIEGRIEGKTEGKMEGKTEVAMMMIKDGEATEKIIRYTGLVQEEIEKLRINGEGLKTN